MSMPGFRKDDWGFLLLAVLWLAAVFMTDPLQEFPLNDDFAYCRDVQNLVNGKGITISEYTAASLLLQILWGALFCIPFGFSIAALKLSTIVAGLAGIYLTYILLLTVSKNKILSLLAAYCLAFCPLYFVLSISFMTDVPFYTLSVGILYCYLMQFNSGENKWLLFAAFLTGLAVLVRQYGLLYAVALLPALFYQQRFKIFSKPVLLGVLNIVVALLVLIIYSIWLKSTRESQGEMTSKVTDILRNFQRGNLYLLGRIAFISFAFIAYISLFLFPVLMGYYVKFWNLLENKQKVLRFIIFSGAIGISLFVLLRFNYTFPFLLNYFYDWGLGPVLIDNNNSFSLPLSSMLCIFLTIISLIGFALSADLFINSLSFDFTPKSITTVFCLMFLAIYFFVNSLIYPFDRYCLPVYPIICLLIFRSDLIFSRIPVSFIIGILVMSFYSVAGSRDYFAWNKIRWEMGEGLLKKGVSVASIDAGLEFNGWYLYDPKYIIKPGKNIWWVEDDLYQVSSYVKPGRKILERREYYSWLQFRRNIIYLTKRID